LFNFPDYQIGISMCKIARKLKVLVVFKESQTRVVSFSWRAGISQEQHKIMHHVLVFFGEEHRHLQHVKVATLIMMVSPSLVVLVFGKGCGEDAGVAGGSRNGATSRSSGRPGPIPRSFGCVRTWSNKCS
jgi:hypothetical protein